MWKLFLCFVLFSLGGGINSKDYFCYPDPPINLENGKVWCNNSNKLDSVCMFLCEPHHTLVGEQATKCIKTGNGTKWTELDAICEVDRCEPSSEVLINGEVICSRQNEVTSVCHYKCTAPGTSMYGNRKGTNKCLPSKEWDDKPPCCQEPCPSKARMDVVILIESTTMFFLTNMITIFFFIGQLIGNFPVSSNLTQFAVLRYTDYVDESMILPLGNGDTVDGLLYGITTKVIDEVEVREVIDVADVGKALLYTKNNVLASGANRPEARDLIVLFTSGQFSDGALASAKAVRDMGATILIIGMKGIINLTRWHEITANPSNVLIYDEESPSEEFSLAIISKICHDFCINSTPMY